MVIYGAGDAGAQLLDALKFNRNSEILFFVDDNPTLWNRTLSGVPIKSPKALLKNKSKIKHILFAIPSLDKDQLIEKICQFRSQGYSVLKVPSLDELIIGKQNIDSLRPIEAEDLLNRSPVSLMPKLLNGKLCSSNVCVTGAGGSIGSELCRQIVKMKPNTIILLEHNENSLYNIHCELLGLVGDKISIHPIFGLCNRCKISL